MDAQDTQTLFLGVIALSTLVMAVATLVAAIFAARTAARLERALTQFQDEVRPLIARATIVTQDAARITGLVADQVERADALVADFARRVDDVVTLVQNAVITPAREGMAVIAAIRAVFEALRGFRGSRGAGGRMEEEDALFIG